MDSANIALVAIAAVLLLAYLMRRRNRVSRED
jgi:hypothetical protein